MQNCFIHELELENDRGTVAWLVFITKNSTRQYINFVKRSMEFSSSLTFEKNVYALQELCFVVTN